MGLRRLQPGLAAASQQLLASYTLTPMLRLLVDWRPGTICQLQSLRQGLDLRLQWCWSHIQEWPSHRLKTRRVLDWQQGQVPPSMNQQLLLQWGVVHRDSSFRFIQEWPRLSLQMQLRQGLRPQLPWRSTQWQNSPRHMPQGLGQGQGLLRSRRGPAQAAALFPFP